MKMSIKYYTVKMFELYQYKFYNEIKLTNIGSTIILGFNYLINKNVKMKVYIIHLLLN